MFLRIIFVAILIGLGIAGYFYISDYLRDSMEQEFRQYASVIAETSVTAELYRNDHDSFLIVRDSILDYYGVTLEEMISYKEEFPGDHQDWVRFWEIVSNITDSLTQIELDEIKRVEDSVIADSLRADSLKADSL